jgi:hypothetical protein
VSAIAAEAATSRRWSVSSRGHRGPEIPLRMVAVDGLAAGHRSDAPERGPALTPRRAPRSIGVSQMAVRDDDAQGRVTVRVRIPHRADADRRERARDFIRGASAIPAPQELGTRQHGPDLPSANDWTCGRVLQTLSVRRGCRAAPHGVSSRPIRYGNGGISSARRMRLRIGDRRQRRDQRPLGVVGYDVPHQQPHRSLAGKQIEAPTANHLTAPNPGRSTRPGGTHSTRRVNEIAPTTGQLAALPSGPQ